jgi:hypothetical protein
MSPSCALLVGSLLAQTVRVDVSQVRNTFRPASALGAGVDRLARPMVDSAYTRAALEPVLSAGWGAASYRLNTELHVEAWHWNPRGTWSDHGRGYFTGADIPGAPIRHSYGYTLPRRGFTRNEGTEAEGFSRLTDGDRRTFWKSNPYLEKPFTGEDPTPQWIVIDLGTPRPVDALRIDWAAPYARRFLVQHWTGEDAMKKPGAGDWQTFPGGTVADGQGGAQTVTLGPAPITVRFVRLLLTASSETCADPSDRRNCLGYAIGELGLGTAGPGGKLRDLLRHSPDQKQGVTYCSSVDPWHEPRDLGQRGVQTGLDLFYTSGVTRGRPAMVPVSVFYGQPDDAAAEIAYLKKRGYPISHVELGEEPDGQFMSPEHYAALYLQFAAAIHRVDPALPLGGPVFTGVNEDIQFWKDAQGKTSWLTRFLDHLRARGRLADLAFMSFEHYPYQPCGTDWEALYDEPRLITHILDVWRKDGLPKDVPLLVTEVNVAWMSSERFVDVWGGLWLADYLGAFLAAGGAGSYFFHYLPWRLSPTCSGQWGTFGFFARDEKDRLTPLAQYFASQVVTRAWVAPGDQPHRVHPATSAVTDAAGHVLVTAYALTRPDGTESVLLVNKDRHAAHTVELLFDGAGQGGAAGSTFTGEVEVTRWGADQYQWHPAGPHGHADPAAPAVVTKERGPGFILPHASLTVLHGRVGSGQDGGARSP